MRRGEENAIKEGVQAQPWPSVLGRGSFFKAEEPMSTPDWIARSEYPFAPHYLEVDGGRMHYVDQGQGHPIVFVHGTPTWSFLYRHLIKELSKSYRCIAPDHIGFGLSDKPADWAYRPEDHARNLRTLIEHLGLHDITLVVHDFGGPIGLSYAVEQQENVSRIVLFNTWMWSLRGDARVERVSRVVSGGLGKFLYMRLNFSPRVLFKAAMGDKTKLAKTIHRHYIDVFPSARERTGPWMLARALLGSSDWYNNLWQQRARIADKPTLILWGMKDPTFGERDLHHWQELFTNAQTITFLGAGHFVQEEEEPGTVVHSFLESSVSVRHSVSDTYSQS